MKRVLIVDDDYSVRELYKYIFSDLGYEVETARNGKEGLEKIAASVPDCALIDIAMPEMTGPEFAGKLRESPDAKWRNLPFIVLTGENCMDISIQYAFQGNHSCKAFIPKMTSPDSIVKMVEDIIRSRE